MLVDKQNELMSDLLFTVHQHGGDDVTRKPPIVSEKIIRSTPPLSAIQICGHVSSNYLSTDAIVRSIPFKLATVD